MASSRTTKKAKPETTKKAKPETTKVKAPKPETANGEDDVVEGENINEEASVFTYVGAGEDSPRKINFMGKQTFVRGEATEVFDQNLIDKLIGNPTFVEGEADADTIAQIEEDAKEEADLKRLENIRIQKEFKKQLNK